MKYLLGSSIIFLLLVFGFILAKKHTPSIIKTESKDSSRATQTNKGGAMKITSSAFGDNQKIPSKFTCDGESVSPHLSFGDVPKNAASLALIMEDPDVPKTIRQDGMWDHWVVYNIPPLVQEIKEGEIPQGVVGVNTSGTRAYTGPCPPDRQHRYFFKLFALDTMLDLPGGVTKDELLETMRSHIIDQAELIGLYSRK